MKFYLSEIKSIESLKELFIEKWNWENPSISDLFCHFPEELNNKIKKYLLLAEKSKYKIFFFNLDILTRPEKELKAIERKIISESELKKIAENSIFIFSSHNFDYLDFLKAEKIGNNIRLKRFSISPDNRDKLRTPSEQLEKLQLEPTKSIADSYIKNKIEEAFSVEVVTEKFYKEYIEIFEKIKKVLIRQKVIIPEGKKEDKLRDFIHQILNRIMFLYFVQKRGCFGKDKNFLANYWDTYKNKFKGKNKFHKEWLNVLFFEALCQPSWFYNEKHYLGGFNEILKYAPYLNGGLFESNELDEVGWDIPDDLFDDIFEFFESYNFTIEESTPFDIDIAINPEMLGNIYEQLVNVEEREEQAKAGIFYTPKVEIELMIRRALVEFFFNKTKIEKEKLYKFLFPEIEKEIENPFTTEEAKKILKELDEIFILDPACGSGHYLVVTLQIIYQLKEILWKKLNVPHLDKYEEKKRILERNIYGNDIKEWAVNIAKLRLWLDLFVDAKEEILKNQSEPLLPNLNFKIRCGDSLVQRIGREVIPLRKIRSFLGSRGGDLKSLILKKEYVYKTSDQKEYKHTLYLEKKLLMNALDDYKIKTQQKIQQINSQLKKIQFNLFGENFEDTQKTLFEKQLKEEKNSLEATLSEIAKLKEELQKRKETPMLWDLAFAEVFQIKNGFDIVIANPPYVRQELIEDLTGFYSKKEYKEKLIEQTINDWSYNLEGKPTISPIKKFDKKSDLYVYFYLKGLKLLNKDGILCYISSNSWLDVGFGAKMQEILLRRVPIVAIYDNQVKRSFKHADVNTIIALLKAPKEKDFDEQIKENEVQFVMFKKPFEEIMYSEIFIDLEKKESFKKLPEGKRKSCETYNLHIANQKDLYQFGKNPDTGLYEGNKWGGKYLRAPEIYWTILEKGKGKLVRLGDIAEVRFGIKTGANEFFYLKPIGMSVKEVVEIAEKNPDALIKVKNSAGWEGEIEVKFLKPVIKSPRELKTIIVKLEDLNHLVFMCHKTERELKGTRALEYIKWGEKQGYHKRPTCKGRERWWELPTLPKADILFNQFFNERFLFPWNKWHYFTDHSYYYIIYPKNPMVLSYVLNTSLNFLMVEIYGRTGLGEGALQTYAPEMKPLIVFNPQKFTEESWKEIEVIFSKKESYMPSSIFTELGFDPKKPIREQEPNPLPDRKALDDIVFDALGLTEEERKEVYWAVAELVKNRLEKAKSV
ncbi:MAG: DNA methyltransferase [Candidatus Pacearchaeota archaeon]